MQSKDLRITKRTVGETRAQSLLLKGALILVETSEAQQIGHIRSRFTLIEDELTESGLFLDPKRAETIARVATDAPGVVKATVIRMVPEEQYLGEEGKK